MKKGFFTLLLAAATQLAFADTYYWVGGLTATSITSTGNWNTQLGGGGTSPSSVTDGIMHTFIFDGSDMDDDPGSQTGPTNITVSGTPIWGQLLVQNLADVTIARSTTGTFTLSIQGTIAGPDFYIDPTSKFTIGGSTGSVAIALRPGTTGEVQGQLVFASTNNNSAIQNRLVSSSNNGLRFKAGSTVTTEAGYAYNSFGTSGSSATPAFGGGVVFEANSRYIHNGGLSPFGTTSSINIVNFLPGSKFYFRAPAVGSQFFTNRPYADVFVENNTTIIFQGSHTRMDSLVINSGSTLVTDSTGAFPIAGHLVVNGSLLSPVPPAERDNKISFVGATPQNISGTGTITVTDVYVSNQSNVTLQKSIKIDSLLMIIGSFNPNGNTVSGSPTTTLKAPASLNVTGSTTDSSFIVGVSDLTDIQIGMSVTGTGIPANTVITNLSTSNSTITISNRATSTVASSSLTIFNGQGTLLPIKFGAISASLVNGQSRINWSILLEESIVGYAIERSTNGTTFEEVGRVNANRSANYSFTDASPAPGVNFYRIKAIGVDGEVKYSSVLRVNNAKGKAELSVYPNPVKGGVVNIQLANLEKGNYTIRIFNTSGQTIFAKVLNHNGGSSNQTLSLPASVKAGVYNLNVLSDNMNLQQRLIVE